MVLLYIIIGIIAGFASFSILLPYGWVPALVSYPVVGALAALIAGLWVVRRGGDNEPS